MQGIGTLRVTDSEGQELEYAVDHLHFHTRSEHTVQGESYDAEMHIVHKLVDESKKDYKQ